MPQAQASPAQAATTAIGVSELKDLVVFLDGRSENAGTLEFAAMLAQEHGARLTGVFIRPAAVLHPSEEFVRGEAIPGVIEAAIERLKTTETDRRARFERVVDRHEILSEWRSADGLRVDELAAHARYADLAIVAREDPSDRGGSAPGLLESLVLTSGRPIVLLPPRCRVSHVRRIVVGWNAGREATRAVAAAMPLLVKAEVVMLLVVDPSVDGRGHGQEPGTDIAQHLARHGARVEVRRLSSGGAEVGGVLLTQAAAFDADLVVMGAYGHSRVSEWLFGGATRTALQKSPLPVLMSA